MDIPAWINDQTSGHWMALVGKVALVLISLFLADFSVKLYRRRKAVRGLPAPPSTFLMGNLVAVGKLRQELPPQIHPHTYVHYLKAKYDLPDVFYIDSWPIGSPILASCDPDVSNKIIVQPSLPKHPGLEKVIEPVTGRGSLVALEGAEHKKWRAAFNPGFSNSHLMTLVGGIVDSVDVFADILEKHARAQDIFSLEEAATGVTVDVIGRVVLDVDMKAQTTENEFVTAFRTSLDWLPDSQNPNPFKWWHPVRQFYFYYNAWRMNRYLTRILKARIAARGADIGGANKPRARPVIDVATDTYMAEQGISDASQLGWKFERAVLPHLRVFMFGGHDTTSSTICYVARVLAEYPECLRRFRAECDDIFGPDVSQTAAKIREDPYKVNRMAYSLALIKEVLRLWPAASSVRAGLPGYYLEHNGHKFPTEGCLVWSSVHATHRNPRLWPEPNTFLPERWLAKDASDPLFPTKGAWRAFEYGPRNCIGQELALLETKIIMALTFRKFVFRLAYDELYPRNDMGNWETDRAYQILVATAKPVHGMPTRVALG